MFPPGPPVHDPMVGGLASQIGERLNLGTAPVSSTSSSAFSALPGSSGNFRNMSPSSPNRLFGAPGAPVAPQTPDGGSSPSILNFGR